MPEIAKKCKFTPPLISSDFARFSRIRHKIKGLKLQFFAISGTRYCIKNPKISKSGLGSLGSLGSFLDSASSQPSSSEQSSSSNNGSSSNSSESSSAGSSSSDSSSSSSSNSSNSVLEEVVISASEVQQMFYEPLSSNVVEFSPPWFLLCWTGSIWDKFPPQVCQM